MRFLRLPDQSFPDLAYSALFGYAAADSGRIAEPEFQNEDPADVARNMKEAGNDAGKMLLPKQPTGQTTQQYFD